ncbi:MAG: 4Fe-4S binding protein [Eggerthellaceae bacterium]|nr:4Fe-4S binding protein [Eggerthellaceae bacterium]
MLDAIKQVFHHGDATIKYPDAPLPPLPPNYRGKPVHDNDLCMCCAACANQCPPNAIQMSLDMEKGTEVWSINYGRCIFCGRCQEVCPTKAITLSDEIELAVLDKDDLEFTATYPLARCSNCGKFYASQKEVDYVTNVLMAATDTLTVEGARYITSRCDECKTRVDALRADAREHTTGQPAAYTADQALHDVYGAPMLNEWAAQTEIGDVNTEDDDLILQKLVERGVITPTQVDEAEHAVETEDTGEMPVADPSEQKEA